MSGRNQIFSKKDMSLRRRNNLYHQKQEKELGGSPVFLGQEETGICLMLLSLVIYTKDASELSLTDTSLVLVVAVLKLLKMATGMRALLDTVVQALPQVKHLPKRLSSSVLFPKG